VRREEREIWVGRQKGRSENDRLERPEREPARDSERHKHQALKKYTVLLLLGRRWAAALQVSCSRTVSYTALAVSISCHSRLRQSVGCGSPGPLQAVPGC
jgi:hypothetical protein